MVDLFTKQMLVSSITEKIAEKTGTYSGSDLKSVCKELVMNKIREKQGINGYSSKINLKMVLKEIKESDIEYVLSRVRPSPSCQIKKYLAWSDNFGSI
jgi:SpoVK/Ycf46/Vps4 family AAA+-type ATPase